MTGINHLPGGINAAMDHLAEALAEDGDQMPEEEALQSDVM